MNHLGWIAALPLWAGCQVVPTASVTPRYVALELDGDIGVSGAGTVVSSSTTGLGIDDDTSLNPRADVSWLGFDVWATWYDARFAGQGRAEGQLDLGGVVINVGDPVASELDLMMATGAATYDLIPGDTIDLGIGLGYGYVDFDAEIRSLSTGEAVGSAETFGMPLLAVRGAIEVGALELSAIIAGLKAKASGDEVELFDADLMLRWHFLNVGSVQGGAVLGYRVTRIDADYEHLGSRVEADLDFAGPYAGLTIQL